MKKATRLKRAKDPPRIKAVDLFCGVGGLTYGLRHAKIEVVAGYDIDEACRYAFERNNKVPFIAADVSRLRARDVEGWLRGTGFRVLAGCAPCQPFSTYSRTRRSDDDRWRLLRSFSRLAGELVPDVVTMENVPLLTRHSVFDRFVDGLKALGYFVWHEHVSCADYGIPQTRKRLVLLASRHGALRLQAVGKPSRTVRDAIGVLPPISAGEESRGDQLHRACALSQINMDRMRASSEGKSWREWDPSLRAACHVRETGCTYPSVYGRMKWDAPAPTITTQFFGFGNGRFGHPQQDRAISLREGAMLQTFPKTYRFERPGERLPTHRVGMLIGNAVPPMLAAHIGSAIREHLMQVAESAG